MKKTKATRSAIGASKDNVVRQNLTDGTFRILMDEDNAPLCGYGNTFRDAAIHLADQLREQARLIEASEGAPIATREVKKPDRRTTSNRRLADKSKARIRRSP